MSYVAQNELNHVTAVSKQLQALLPSLLSRRIPAASLLNSLHNLFDVLQTQHLAAQAKDIKQLSEVLLYQKNMLGLARQEIALIPKTLRQRILGYFSP